MTEPKAQVARVDFDNTPDDLRTFYRHFVRTSPIMKRRFATMLASFAFVVVVMAFTVFQTEWPVRAAIAGTMFVGFAVILKLTFASLSAKQMERMVMSGKTVGLIGRKTLILTHTALIERREGGENTFNLKALDKVETTDEQLLIFVNAAMAHVVPRRAFADADHLERFASAVRDGMKASA
jgi:hypothetical protein